MKTLLHYLKVAISTIIILISSGIFSQEGINYQGVARDANSELLTNTNITLDINVVKTSVGGTVVYSEIHDLMTDINGVFSTVIGKGVPSFNLFSDINWAEDKHFLKVRLDGVEVGTSEFVNVPYANAMGKWQAHKNGVTPKGTGRSIFIGDNAGELDDFTDNDNIGFGYNALARNNNGQRNVAIGYETLRFNAEGNNNTALGHRGLSNNISGMDNIAVGQDALFANTTGGYNIAMGKRSLRENTEGHNNVALGQLSLRNNTTGYSNIANGMTALYSNTEGNDNLAMGTFSMYENTIGSNNIALGSRSLQDNTIGNYNVATGFQTLTNNTSGDFNVALGHEALFSNTSGEYNIASGYNTLHSNTTGTRNIAIGKETMQHNTTGFVNIAIGASTLNFNTTGNSNIAIGASALYANTVGSKNIALGGSAGQSSNGNYNIYIGTLAGFNVTGNNRLYINNHILPDAFPLIYGEFDNKILGFDAKVGIGTQSPELPFQVVTGSDVNLTDGSGQVIIGTEGAANLVMDNNEIQVRNNGAVADLYLQNEGGNVRVGGAVVHASDRRLKRDIEDISYGLKEVLQLEPKEYFWKGKTQDHKSFGLIAQEVNEIIKNVVTYNTEDDKYGISYTEIIPVLIKAIQEQQKIIETQQQSHVKKSHEISELENRIQLIEKKLMLLN